MPVVRGLGVVAKTEGKKQIEAVRAELRTQAFWTRRKRRSLSHARSSGGEGSVFSSRSGSEDDDAEGFSHTNSATASERAASGASTSFSVAAASQAADEADSSSSSGSDGRGVDDGGRGSGGGAGAGGNGAGSSGVKVDEQEAETLRRCESSRASTRLNSTQTQIAEIIKQGNLRAKSEKEKMRSKRRTKKRRTATGEESTRDGSEPSSSGISPDNSGQMAVLLQCRVLNPGNSALLLQPETRALLDIDVRGHTVEAEQGLADFRNSNWREKRALVHQVMMEPGSSRLATIISAVIMLVILVSSTTFCLETMEEYRDVTALKWVESVSIVIFTLEYLVKIVTAPNLWRFVRAPLNLIDLIAILPWYIDLFVATGKSQGTSVLRIIRLARILKLGGRYGKFQVVSKAMLVSLDVLGVLFFMLVITVVIFSTLVYYSEYPPPKDERYVMVPQEFTSIPESFWWAIVTVNTVGYGDVVPLTLWGKIVAGGLMIVGLLIMALPISVIGTNFTAEWMEYKDFLAQRESIKHLPHKVILFEELLSEHVSNIEDIISRYSETEEELDYLRMKMQDKIIQKKAEMDQRHGTQDDMSEISSLHGSRRQLTFKNLFPKDKPKTRDRYTRELSEIKHLEQQILNKSAYLNDLLSATEFLRSGYFEEKVKSLRMKYKQLEFIKEESYVLRSALDEVEAQVRKVAPNMDFTKPMTRDGISQFDPLTAISASAAWTKVKKYSRITAVMSRKIIPISSEGSTEEGSTALPAKSRSLFRVFGSQEDNASTQPSQRRSVSANARPAMAGVIDRALLLPQSESNPV